MTSTFLNAYDAGNKIGGVVTYSLVIIMAIIWIWVMFKYLNTSDLHD